MFACIDSCTCCTRSYYWEETDHTGEGKWKHVLKREGFDFHESSVSLVVTASLSVDLPVSSPMTLYLTPHLSLSVSLALPLFLSPCWQRHMRYAVQMCKYCCFSSQITSIFTSSPFHKAASLWRHHTTERMSSPVSLPFTSPLLSFVSALHPLALVTLSPLVVH